MRLGVAPPVKTDVAVRELVDADGQFQFMRALNTDGKIS